MASAKKRKSKESDSPHENEKQYVLNLSGNLRRSFAIQAALTDTYQSEVCSPLSALVPLAKLALGAKDKTLTELLTATGVSSQSKISSFKKTISKLKSMNFVTLDIASRIYLGKDHLLKSHFRETSEDIFGSSVELVDFQKTATVAHEINSFVKFETKDMIQKIITSEEISTESSLILVNAVYFKGKWKYPFEKVYSGSFFTPGGKQKVTMMNREGKYKYIFSETLDSQVIEIPYGDEKASFVIFLPKELNGLSDLLKKLKSPDLMKGAMEKMKKTRINLTMPKFKLESQWNLKELYDKIGIKELDSGQGLTDMVQDLTVFVSGAVQKAIIEVDEKGATAAVTAGMGSALHAKEIFFTADHSFFFMIVANSEQLFTGTLIALK